MFKSNTKNTNGRRRQTAKRSWRSLVNFRRFDDETQPKRRKKEKQKQEYIPEEELLKRIGASNTTFNDYTTGDYYDWDREDSPYIVSSESMPYYQQSKGVRSLKTLCAMKIADNHELLNSKLLEEETWTIWQLVWDYIAKWNRDSFLVYQLFANTFSKEESFSSHPSLRHYPNSKRTVLMFTTFPNSSNHRVERLFDNFMLSNFMNSLNSCLFKNLVILEIETPSITNDDYIRLTNLTNLTSLKISNGKQVPTEVIHSWCSSLRSQKWTKLQLISLPDISEDSIIKLQNIAKHCLLLYIELQSSVMFNMKKNWDKVDYENWLLVNDPSLNNLSWGMKSLLILRDHGIKDHSVLPNEKTMCLDFNIINQSYKKDNTLLEKQSDYDNLWKAGILQTYYQGLILKEKLEVKVMNRKPQTNTKPLVLKKKLIKTVKGKHTHESFFDL